MKPQIARDPWQPPPDQPLNAPKFMRPSESFIASSTPEDFKKWRAEWAQSTGRSPRDMPSEYQGWHLNRMGRELGEDNLISQLDDEQLIKNLNSRKNQLNNLNQYDNKRDWTENFVDKKTYISRGGRSSEWDRLRADLEDIKDMEKEINQRQLKQQPNEPTMKNPNAQARIRNDGPTNIPGSPRYIPDDKYFEMQDRRIKEANESTGQRRNRLRQELNQLMQGSNMSFDSKLDPDNINDLATMVNMAKNQKQAAEIDKQRAEQRVEPNLDKKKKNRGQKIDRGPIRLPSPIRGKDAGSRDPNAWRNETPSNAIKQRALQGRMIPEGRFRESISINGRPAAISEFGQFLPDGTYMLDDGKSQRIYGVDPQTGTVDFTKEGTPRLTYGGQNSNSKPRPSAVPQPAGMPSKQAPPEPVWNGKSRGPESLKWLAWARENPEAARQSKEARQSKQPPTPEEVARRRANFKDFPSPKRWEDLSVAERNEALRRRTPEYASQLVLDRAQTGWQNERVWSSHGPGNHNSKPQPMNMPLPPTKPLSPPPLNPPATPPSSPQKPTNAASIPWLESKEEAPPAWDSKKWLEEMSENSRGLPMVEYQDAMARYREMARIEDARQNPPAHKSNTRGPMPFGGGYAQVADPEAPPAYKGNTRGPMPYAQVADPEAGRRAIEENRNYNNQMWKQGGNEGTPGVTGVNSKSAMGGIEWGDMWIPKWHPDYQKYADKLEAGFKPPTPLPPPSKKDPNAKLPPPSKKDPNAKLKDGKKKFAPPGTKIPGKPGAVSDGKGGWSYPQGIPSSIDNPSPDQINKIRDKATLIANKAKKAQEKANKIRKGQEPPIVISNNNRDMDSQGETILGPDSYSSNTTYGGSGNGVVTAGPTTFFYKGKPIAQTPPIGGGGGGTAVDAFGNLLKLPPTAVQFGSGGQGGGGSGGSGGSGSVFFKKDGKTIGFSSPGGGGGSPQPKPQLMTGK